jgi:glycosyltransferase involved in cell wall biosynthesis
VFSLSRTVKLLRRIVSERHIDTVVSFLIHANAVAAWALKPLPDVRLIQSIQTTQQKPRWHWWLQGRVHRRAGQIVVPSQAIVEAAGARSGISPDKFVVIPNALDPSDFQRVPVFQGDVVRVGFLGRIDPVKRVFVAFRAAYLVRDLPARLVIFGGGPGSKHVRGQLELAKGDWNVNSYRGPVSRPQDALAEMDVLLLPSIGEGFGLVLIEAMASGVPVIASAAGAIPEIVRNGENGLLVPVSPNDSREFAEAIRKLHGDRAFRDRLIANGLAEVRARFTWDVTLPQYRSLLGV